MTTKPNSKVRDRVFRMLFAEKKNALELYNALNGTQYVNEEELEITTLDDAIYMSMKNDVSFLINETMNLFEHQSTINPNLPLRGLFYFAKLYKRYTADMNQYGSKLIKLPSPCYIVFYNGKEDIGEEKWLKLSDAFQQGNEQSHMELWAQMININYGRNQKFMKKCRIMEEYSIFTNKIRIYQETMEADEAIERAIEECIEEGKLADFLRRRRADVMDAFLTEYDEEKTMAAIGQERYEDGVAAERKNTERERQRAEKEREKAEIERQRAEKEREKAELANQKVEQERQRAVAAEAELQKLKALLAKQ